MQNLLMLSRGSLWELAFVVLCRALDMVDCCTFTPFSGDPDE